MRPRAFCRWSMLVLLLAGCRSSPLASISHDALIALADEQLEVVDQPKWKLVRQLGEEICRRVVNDEESRDWSDSGLWLTAAQRMTVLNVESGRGYAWLKKIAPQTGWFREELAMLAREGHLEPSVIGPQAPAVSSDGASVFAKLEQAAELSAGTLLAEVRRSDGGVWPNDSQTQVCRLVDQRPDLVAASLEEAVRASEDAVLPYWSAMSLVRMGKWDAGVLLERECDWSWDAMKYHAQEASRNPVRWEAFVAALTQSPEYSPEGLSEAGTREVVEKCVGVWLARTGDEMGSPSMMGEEQWASVSARACRSLLEGSNGRWLVETLETADAVTLEQVCSTHLAGELSERDKRRLKQSASPRATVLLAEHGEGSATSKAFWGVWHGVVASGVVLDGQLLEAAWRSGSMLDLLRQALDRGGVWVHLAQTWLADGNAAVWQLELPEFEKVLAALLQDPNGIKVVKCPLAQAWVVLPR